MQIKYTVFDPSKNITALVESPVPEGMRAEIAALIMKKEEGIEQLGFISMENGTLRLFMAGGEFCGNACRCAASLTGAKSVVCADETVKCEGSAVYLPKELKGIRHYIFEEMIEEPEKKAVELASGEGAVGLMFLNEAEMSLRPLVYVPGAGTLIWENSCASGSAAVGAYLARKYNRAVDIELKQPGGVLSVRTSPGDSFVSLDGELSIIRQGVLCIPEQSCL